MPEKPLPLAILGVAFLLVGVVLALIGAREERAYDRSLASRPDLREFLTGWPPRSWRKTLIIGGVTGLAAGIVLLVISAVLWLKA